MLLLHRNQYLAAPQQCGLRCNRGFGAEFCKAYGGHFLHRSLAQAKAPISGLGQGLQDVKRSGLRQNSATTPKGLNTLFMHQIGR